MGRYERPLSGASIDKESDLSGKPLSRAAGSGQLAIARLRLQNGANMDERDASHGRRPLMFAVEMGHQAGMQLLVDSGADVMAEDPHT